MREYKLLKFDEKELIAKAKKEEQERIIKVLDEQLGSLDYTDLIALIKGENK